MPPSEPSPPSSPTSARPCRTCPSGTRPSSARSPWRCRSAQRVPGGRCRRHDPRRSGRSGRRGSCSRCRTSCCPPCGTPESTGRSQQTLPWSSCSTRRCGGSRHPAWTSRRSGWSSCRTRGHATGCADDARLADGSRGDAPDVARIDRGDLQVVGHRANGTRHPDGDGVSPLDPVRLGSRTTLLRRAVLLVELGPVRPALLATPAYGDLRRLGHTRRPRHADETEGVHLAGRQFSDRHRRASARVRARSVGLGFGTALAVARCRAVCAGRGRVDWNVGSHSGNGHLVHDDARSPEVLVHPLGGDVLPCQGRRRAAPTSRRRGRVARSRAENA